MKENIITSFEIRNTSWGERTLEDIIVQQLTLDRTGCIKHSLFNSLSDLPVEEHEYNVDTSKMEIFFDFISSIIQSWETDYRVEVCDGWHWQVNIKYSDNTFKKVVGTVQSPPNGELLRQHIYDLVDFKVNPWIF